MKVYVVVNKGYVVKVVTDKEEAVKLMKDLNYNEEMSGGYSQAGIYEAEVDGEVLYE